MKFLFLYHRIVNEYSTTEMHVNEPRLNANVNNMTNVHNFYKRDFITHINLSGRGVQNFLYEHIIYLNQTSRY